MGKNKEYQQDLRYTVSMPKEVFKNIDGIENVRLLGGYDAAMYEYYRNDAQWQEAEYFYEIARSRKKLIESNIEIKISKNI